jgi:hypothetical protein
VIPRWDTWETALREMATADIADGPGLPVPTLLLFDTAEVELLVRGRVEGDRDGCDHLSEMATIVAARQAPRVVWAVSGRMRDLTRTRDAEPAAQVLVCSSVERRDGGWQHRARMLPWHLDADDVVLGPSVDIEVELSPVGGLLDDAVRHPSGHDPVRTLSVLASWGHTAAIPAEHQAAGNTQPSLPPPRSDDRHRTHRLALELCRRYLPTAPAEAGRRRPAIVTDIPPGWEAACPL